MGVNIIIYIRYMQCIRTQILVQFSMILPLVVYLIPEMDCIYIKDSQKIKKKTKISKIKKKAKIPRVTDVGCSCLAYAVEKKKSKRMVQ